MSGMVSDNRKIGIGLSLAGMFFTTLGIFLFFDRGLLAMGNLLFLSGVVLIIGPAKTYRFFFQARKAKGTACFLGGIALVLYGWTIIGICIEGWGFLNLFGDFFPTALCAAPAAAAPSAPRFVVLLLAAAAPLAAARRSPRSLARVRLFFFCVTPRLTPPPNLAFCARGLRRGFMRNMPIIGNFLCLPMVRAVTDRLVTKSRLPV